MRFHGLAAFLVPLSISLLHAAPVPEEQKPAGPAPRLFPAPQVDDNGQLTFHQVRVENREEIRTQTIIDPQTGKVVQVTEKVLVPVFTESKQALSAKDYTAYDVAGTKIEDESLADALKKHPLVLLSSDGKKVDPAYLKMFRDGTVVLVVTPAALAKLDNRIPPEAPPLPKDR
jgi:hypothetical protein